jgi:hypothetical protein
MPPLTTKVLQRPDWSRRAIRRHRTGVLGIREHSPPSFPRRHGPCLEARLWRCRPPSRPRPPETQRSRHDDEFPLIACALALAFEHGPNEAEDLAKAADLLAEMGLEFDPAELRAVKRSEACAEFRFEFCRVPPAALSDAQMAAWHGGLRDCLLRAGEALRNS